MNVEHGTFTPLIFSTTGGVGPEAERFHKELANKISAKSGDKYGEVMRWMRCKLSFVILRAFLTCIRGSRPHKHRSSENIPDDIGHAWSEADNR